MKEDQQLRIVELKARQLSLKYLQLEQSGECLNYLIRFDPKRLNHKSLEFESIDLREVFTLMVQSVYLMLNATLRRLSLWLSKAIHISRISSNHFTVHKMYLLDEHYFQLNGEIQGYVQKYFDYFPVSSNGVFKGQVMGIIYSGLEAIKRYSSMYPEFINKVYKSQFEQFCFIVHEMIRPNLPLIHTPVKLVECCQQSQVFRDGSLLLNIKANLVYDQLRRHIEDGIMFERFLEMQDLLLKQMRKGEVEKQKVVKQWIEKVVRLLIEAKVVFSELSQEKEGKKRDERMEKEKKERWEIFTKQKRKVFMSKYGFEALSNWSQNQLTEGQAQSKEKVFKKNSFIVEYDSRREVVSLKMLTTMAFTLQSSDLLAYQASLTGESWVFPSLSVIETVHNSVKQQWMGLSTFFRIMPSQHPTTQFLLQLDTLMVHSKIVAFELSQPPYKRNLPHKLNLSQCNSERIRVLLLANIKKVYDVQLEESESEG